MCTLSIIPLADAGWRAVFNRDEQRTRAAARAPEQRQLGDRRGLFPIDPSSDGTWIGINDAGLFLALLNLNISQADSWQRSGVASPSVSRGTIIPDLLQAANLAEIRQRLKALPLARMPHFQLVLVAGRRVVFGPGTARP